MSRMIKWFVNIYLGGMVSIFPTAYVEYAQAVDPVMEVVRALVTWPMLYSNLL